MNKEQQSIEMDDQEFFGFANTQKLLLRMSSLERQVAELSGIVAKLSSTKQARDRLSMEERVELAMKKYGE